MFVAVAVFVWLLWCMLSFLLLGVGGLFLEVLVRKFVVGGLLGACFLCT